MLKSKNKFTLILFIAMLSFLFTSFAYGDNMQMNYIRVGLKGTVNSNNIISLVSNGFRVGYLNEEFNYLFDINSDSILARSDDFYTIENGSYVKTSNYYLAQIGPFHLEIDKVFNSNEELLKEIEELKKLNINAFPAYIENEYRVWIGQYVNEEEALNDITNLTSLIDYNLNLIKENKNRVVIEDKNNILLIFNSLEKIALGGRDNETLSLIKVGKNNYRDYITFHKGQNELIAINYVELNNYLYGVVPREMSASWPLEALKAQSVAARNFTLLSKNKHNSSGYDLCDTQDCQVYGGYDWENIRSNTAVDETADNVLTYNGQLVNTYYHSTSGGHTENSENVWSNAVPYLKGVNDEFSLGSPNDEWQLLMSKEDISQKLNANGYNIGEVISVEVKRVSEYGRVLELLIRGTKSDVILEKQNIRNIFGTSNLKSTWFSVKADADVYIMNGESRAPFKTSIANYSIITSDGIVSFGSNQFVATDGIKQNRINTSSGQYIFDGKGWGHGIGMSQWGAKGMAEQGYTYKEILEYYYTGAIVE